VHLRKNL